PSSPARRSVTISSAHPSVGDPSTNAKLSEKMRGARGDRHGGQHDGNRQAEGQCGDQRGQGASIARRVLVARRHSETVFGRSSEHGRSFNILSSTVPFPSFHMAGNVGEAVGK